MAWKDTLRTASFRGIPFLVDGHDAEFGRRNETHQIAQRDKPYTEDLGKAARGFSIDAYVLGDNYARDRDRLIEAFETAGPGDLVHPYLGNMRVDGKWLRVRESSRDGRICYLQMTFVESGEAAFPSNDTDSVKSITSSANDAIEAAGSGFAGKFTVDGFPSFVVDAAAGRLGGLSDLITNLPINPMASAQVVADFSLRVRSLKTQALRLINSPRDMASSIMGVISSVRDVFGVRSTAVLRTIRVAYTAPYTGPTNTPNRVQQKTNDEAFSALIRQSSISEQAKSAGVTANNSAAAASAARGDAGDSVAAVENALGTDDIYQSRDEAVAARDEITDVLDSEMEDPATGPAEFQQFTRLRTEVVRGVPAPNMRLPSLAEVTPPSTLPSLVVSYAFYENAGRAVEISKRNKVPHPGFLQGGQPLEVVADA